MSFLFELILIFEGRLYAWSLGVFGGRLVVVIVFVRVLEVVVFLIRRVCAIVSLERASSA